MCIPLQSLLISHFKYKQTIGLLLLICSIVVAPEANETEKNQHLKWQLVTLTAIIYGHTLVDWIVCNFPFFFLFNFIDRCAYLISV